MVKDENIQSHINKVRCTLAVLPLDVFKANNFAFLNASSTEVLVFFFFSCDLLEGTSTAFPSESTITRGTTDFADSTPSLLARYWEIADAPLRQLPLPGQLLELVPEVWWDCYSPFVPAEISLLHIQPQEWHKSGCLVVLAHEGG